MLRHFVQKSFKVAQLNPKLNCVCAFTQSKSAFCTRRFSTKRVNEAFVLKGPDNANIEQVPMPPQPRPNQVLLRTLNVGICGSDTHYWHDGACGVYVVKKPMILGHETSAVVESVGSKVKHLKPGDRVVTEPAVPCESCDFCRSGMYNLCPDVACHATPPYDGTLTNYFVHHSGYTFKIPDSITNEEAALIEPLSVGVYSCKRANVTVGSRVLITGAGPIGIVTAMAAKAFGATKVVLTDVNQKRLNLAKELGADQVILMTDNMTEKEMIEKIKNEFNGEQPNISIECSGAAACSRLVLLATKSGGVAVLVGLGPAEVLLPIADAASREVTILGAFRYKHCFPTAIDLAASGTLQLNKLASHRFDFKDCSKAFEMARSGAGMKIVIKYECREKCRVCGDKALAFNFNALSCECCKIFFRRNAAIREKLNCRKDGACEIDFITRKCCAKCRLEKCFGIGMAIELRKKRNRFYKSKNSENEINLKQILLQDDQLYIKSNINVDYQKTKSPTKLEYEKNLISEIEKSISIFEDEYKLPCIGEATNVQEAFNMPGLYARKIVKFCKNITAFKVLSGKDQFALLKPFYFEFIAIWLGFLYDPLKDGFPLLENESGHRVVFVNLGLCNQLNDKTIGQTMREFGIESKAKMENDLTIRNLIIAMLLFKPRDSVSAREFVRYQYHVYYNLLEKYFETKHSTNQKNLNQAKLKFTSLQHVLNSLDVVRDSTRRAIFELDLNKVAEIVYEVFGMENN